MAPMQEAVYATLLMSDAYLPGAMVLAHSLRDKGAKAKIVVLATLDTLSSNTITELKTVYDEVIPINRITNRTPANLYIMERPDLISTFTKIELWRQTQYRQIVYMDADVVAIRAPNELLTLDADFAAAPDIGWPDCFNSGVMVLRPNMGDYYSLLALAQRGISFDGADQGLLNMHFQDWERLSFTYNCTPNSSYQYIPAYRHFQSSISMIHFIGKDKPWTLGRDHKKSTGVYGELLGRWWATYDKHYRIPKTPSQTVQSQVIGEPLPTPSSQPSQPIPPSQPTFSSTPATTDVPSAENITTPVEPPMGDKPEVVEEIQYGDFKPTPTVEQRRFSAPQSDWNPAHAPPPVHSKPEASNFPSQTYYMSEETKLFTPPTKYPDPPKDMYYEVPEKAPAPPKPKQIFPWESHARKATRVFPAEPPEPQPQPEPEPESESEPEPAATTTTATETTTTDTTATDITAPAKEPPPSDQERPTSPMAIEWQTYGNAWDDMPEIERYVQAFAQHRRGPVQVLHQTALAGGSNDRRPSVKVTDFPTEIERPSLPVTPAPIRRPSFWGEERDELGQLPAAEGVPKQEEWRVLYWRCQFCGKQNPVMKLEELQRRQSEVIQTGPQPKSNDIPERQMPESKDAAAAAAASDRGTLSRQKG